MLETSARLLRLLGLFQARRDWTGPELAHRLGVTTRTIRNDVDRLRNLGYPVDATPGVAGGYRLGSGAALPPLLLTDDEAVAVAVGLRTAAAGSVTGIEESSVGALAKLEQVLPAKLRHRVNALQTYTVPIGGSGPSVDPSVLTAIAAVCRDRERLRFDYVSHDGSEAIRTVEPHRLAHLRGRWYLVAWDLDRADWRTFRVDRMTPRTPTGPRFQPRELPAGDVAAFVTEGTGAATWRYRFKVMLHAPADEVAAKLPPPVRIEQVDDSHCIMHAGSDTLDLAAIYIGMLDVEFDVIEPPELIDRLRHLAARYLRAAGNQSGQA
ncbi:MAG TPA: YafY family protein [Jiangellaceae bacterium]|nr:YafY family protein [Jiangellaceae bacterium]